MSTDVAQSDKVRLKLEKKRVTLKQIMRVHNAREIVRLTIPIFLQLLFNILVMQINTIIMSWYDQQHYYAAVTKAINAFNFLQFVPSLIASGTLIVCGNLLGQGRKKEVGDVILSGIIVNFVICVCLYAIMYFIAPFLLVALGATDNTITGTNINELDFCLKYYHILLTRMVIMSMVQVLISGMQSMKRNKHVMIGAIMANIVDAVLMVLFLFVFDISPLWTAITPLVAGVLQLVYMMILIFWFVQFKNGVPFLQKIKRKYLRDTLFLGAPIALEMGLWSLAQLFANMIVATLGNSELELCRSVQALSQYSTVFVQALATVTSVLVAHRVGAGDNDGAYRIGLDCWKLALYVSTAAAVVELGLTYPLLWIFNTPPAMINRVGYWIFFVLIFRTINDTANLTILRALWSCNDVWFPLLVSIFAMFIGQVGFPAMMILGFHVTGEVGLIMIFVGFAVDPSIRSACYTTRWFKGTWRKYAHKL